ncbi:MAG: hypothetical protein ACTSWY_11255 [Promethearchaeota archaeon]
MRRLRIPWEKIYKINTLIIPVLVSAVIICLAFFMSGLFSPFFWMWTTGTFGVVYLIYIISLFLEPTYFIKNIGDFIRFKIILGIWGVLSGISVLILSFLMTNFLIALICIIIIAVFYVAGLIRIRIG